MKKKRSITLKDPRLIRARTELRMLLSLVWDKQVSELHKNFMTTTDIEKKDEISKKIKALTNSLHRAPIGCRVCGHLERDLTYIPAFDTWYCEPCYLFNQDYYKRHPEEADWKALYP
jgi:hypothetical protein